MWPLDIRLKRSFLAAAAALITAGLAACGSSDSTPTPASTAAPATTTGASGASGDGGAMGMPADIGKDDSAELTGAGATFPAPVYQAWFADYHDMVASGVRVNYQAIGSGGGIQQFTEQTVDFGASDAPMSEEELAATPNAQHLPTVLGAVVVTYNIDGVDQALKLDGDTLAKIFLGEITKWTDPAITGENAEASLPDKDIQVVHRSDGSGTTFVFTDFLSKVSPDWETRVGTNKNPDWPTGQGGKGNDGVTNAVKQTPNSIGYVELNYALANSLPFADMKNQAGKFVTPSIDSTSQAAAGVTLPDDYRVSITNAEGNDAYPIASFTYLLVRKDMASCETAKPLGHLLWWVYNSPDPSATAKDLNYAPLPESVQTRVKATLESLTCEGSPLFG